MHSHAGFQGIDNWSAVCWIGGGLLGEQLDTVPFTVGAWSNGAMSSLAVGSNLLLAQPHLEGVLVTTGDRFGPLANRFHASPGMIFGDGAAAAVVSRRPGGVLFVSIVGETDTVLGGLARGSADFAPSPAAEPPDGRERTREFLASGRVSLRGIQERSRQRIRSVVDRALADAGLEARDVDWLAAPFIGRTLFRESFLRPLEPGPARDDPRVRPHRRPPQRGRPARQTAQAVTTGTAEPGQHVLAVGTGMGFTYAAAVLRVGDPA